MATNYPVNPRVRAYGKARIDFARRAKTPDDWVRLWVQPANPFPFSWGGSWKHSVEYKVDDFAAEVGFFIDILGLTVNIFDPGYAMFTSPQGDFFFSVVPSDGLGASTPPDALRLQFMVSDINRLSRELELRGIAFDQPPEPVQPGSSLKVGYFRTPHGICIDLFGMDEDTTRYTDLSDLEGHETTPVSDQYNMLPEFQDDAGGMPVEDALPPRNQEPGSSKKTDRVPVYEDETFPENGDSEQYSPLIDSLGEDHSAAFDFLDDTIPDDAEDEAYIS